MHDLEIDLHRTVQVAVDGDRLAGYALRRIGRKEQYQRRDLFRLGERLERLVRERVQAFLRHRSSARRGPRLEHALHAFAATGPGRIALARIPNVPSSMDSVFVKPMTPHLLVA